LVEPGPDGLSPCDGAGLADQGDEGCLEAVLNVVLVRQEPLADAEHGRPVAIDKQFEGGFIAQRYPSPQESGVVRTSCAGLADGAAETVQ
jgi:hypothetical protein